MKKLAPTGKEEVVYQGKIFEVVQQPFQASQKEVIFEFTRRAPGTRLLIVKDRKILLTKEYRWELKDFDFRLPGGKVFDTLKDYQQALSYNKNIQVHALEAASRECLEETGLIPVHIQHIHTTSPDATVQWDIFYFLIDHFKKQKSGQLLGDGELIKPIWIPFKEVKEMCLSGKIKEDRSVAVLLRFLLKND